MLLFAASLSIAVPGRIKWETSAMWTPTWKYTKNHATKQSQKIVKTQCVNNRKREQVNWKIGTWKFPLGKAKQCNASSMSVHPGGSTEQMAMCLRSTLSFSSLGVMDQGNVGRQSRTASPKDEWGISCSSKRTWFSVALSPIGPRHRIKWPTG